MTMYLCLTKGRHVAKGYDVVFWTLCNEVGLLQHTRLHTLVSTYTDAGHL
jgi:hypothetical protein